MLAQIFIRDLATIESLSLNFSRGTTMITGETGAGKSIFIEAIELALGGRASANLVRQGKEKAEITLCFDISNFPKVIAALKAQDLMEETEECIIRRTITADGRSRCYVNGLPATVHLTRELGEQLFHLHSQHEQQILLCADQQREMLDRYASHTTLLQEVKTYALKYKDQLLKIKQYEQRQKELRQQKDYLSYQLQEFEALQLKEGEWQSLELKHQRLTNMEELLKNLHQAICHISSEDQTNIISQMTMLRRLIETLQKYEPHALSWRETIHTILVHLEELETDIRHYVEKTQLDPDELKKTEERVTQIFNLARKYKVQPQDLADYYETIRTEFSKIANSDETLEHLRESLKQLKQQYIASAKALTTSRQQHAKRLQETITQIIRGLSLPHSEFEVFLEPEKNDEPHVHGNERITFLIKANPDQNLQPLAKVISGGELSRLSLAAHLALADKTNIPTLIFDEVDTGLSGATAEKIGKLLHKLGQSYQVFCISHQPQVAAYGHHHLLVEKNIRAQKTHTVLRLLSPAEKAKEIARMLGGEKITRKTLEHAQEILESL